MWLPGAGASRQSGGPQHVLQIRPVLDTPALAYGREALEHGGRLARRPVSRCSNLLRSDTPMQAYGSGSGDGLSSMLWTNDPGTVMPHPCDPACLPFDTSDDVPDARSALERCPV
jgi:hypothetical protein